MPPLDLIKWQDQAMCPLKLVTFPGESNCKKYSRLPQLARLATPVDWGRDESTFLANYS